MKASLFLTESFGWGLQQTTVFWECCVGGVFILLFGWYSFLKKSAEWTFFDWLLRLKKISHWDPSTREIKSVGKASKIATNDAFCESIKKMFLWKFSKSFSRRRNSRDIQKTPKKEIDPLCTMRAKFQWFYAIRFPFLDKKQSFESSFLLFSRNFS